MISKSYSNINWNNYFCVFKELFVLQIAFAVFPTKAAIYLNDLELLILKSVLLLAGTSFLLNFYKLLDVSE